MLRVGRSYFKPNKSVGYTHVFIRLISIINSVKIILASERNLAVATPKLIATGFEFSA